MSESNLDCDVLIVGGGLVGSALALALGTLPLRVIIVESHDVRATGSAGFDARATALANGTRHILDSLAVWPQLRPRAEAITEIHVSERGRFGGAHFAAAEENVAALGYTVENRDLGAALWQVLGDSTRFEVLSPARYVDSSIEDDAIDALIEVEGSGRRHIRTRVVVAADGARSGVRSALGTGASQIDYEQSAVIFNCRLQRPLAGLAVERFMPEGPLAVLPLPDERGGVVWSLPSAGAQRLLESDDAAVCEAFEKATGGRLGPLERIGERALFPLYRVRSARVYGPRAVLIGSAAVNLHPVAGQGFNLAMRDVAWLAEVFADTLATQGPGADIGTVQTLQRYARQRGADHGRVAGFTHGLVRLFGADLPGFGAVRGLGLLAFDVLPGARRQFARHAMGRAGRSPRLACGQPL